MNEQEKSEKKRLRIDKKQFPFANETKCDERELQERRNRECERSLEVHEQCLRLDHKKSECEKQEREAAFNERTMFIELMGALLKSYSDLTVHFDDTFVTLWMYKKRSFAPHHRAGYIL